MYLSRALSSGFVCSACRGAAVRRASPAAKASMLRASSSAPATPSRRPRCAFSTSVARTADTGDVASKDPEFAFLDAGAKPAAAAAADDDIEASTDAAHDASTPSPNNAPSTSPNEASPDVDATDLSTIPWYLRQQGVVAGHLQKPTDIPDLPPNPPPLLAPLLDYLSITAGLDDMQLFDLRHLDPPPALGPKLIMLIATARSEKHLHVAADRFCRFLRREHNLKANAAGLLGRNELKIKLRRKAKRMRMLANVGSVAQEGSLDDGIRTGWICCTLSKIEAHELDQHMPGDDVEEFVGFRHVKPGVNLVVQMFTEEKRAETDLETLWGGVVRTQKREVGQAEDFLRALDQEEMEEELFGEETDEAHVGDEMLDKRQNAKAAPSPSPPKQFHRPRASPGDFFPPAGHVASARQLRRLHTVGLK